MKTCGTCKEEKPLDHFTADRTKHDGRCSRCQSCARAYGIAYREKNLASLRVKKKAYYAAHSEDIRKKASDWYYANLERYDATHVAWRDANRDAAQAKVTKWKKAHPERVKDMNHRSHAVRRDSQKMATPPWANTFFIKEAYDLARRRTKATGFKWHVDHIIPVVSKLVCGLHVENNIRVVPAVVNARKANTKWPDMPEKLYG